MEDHLEGQAQEDKSVVILLTEKVLSPAMDPMEIYLVGQIHRTHSDLVMDLMAGLLEEQTPGDS